MKNVNNALLIHYFGAAWNRYHCIQRAGGDFWTGDSWSRILDCAKIFREHREAQRECAVIQYQQYKGLPFRTFKIEMAITLVAADVRDISLEALAKFIAEAVRIDVANSIHGDGPVNGGFVQAQMKLSTLKETKPGRKRF